MTTNQSTEEKAIYSSTFTHEMQKARRDGIDSNEAEIHARAMAKMDVETYRRSKTLPDDWREQLERDEEAMFADECEKFGKRNE